MSEARRTLGVSMKSATERLPVERVVDNRTYWDPRVFDLEMERIFAKAWVFACHESELREPGDYITIDVARSPVIVNRDRSGRLRAFYNTCRHRASLVVKDESGHCSSFRCPYHFWVYSLEGELIGIPEESAYDDTGFRKEEFPLVGVACESVLGLVFVNLSPEHESLEDWLGKGVIDVLRTPLENGTFEVFNRKKIDVKANWKVWGENSRDGYHVPFVHPFFRRASPPGEYTLLDNGHAVQRLGMDPKGIEPELWESLKRHPLPGVGVGEGYIVTIFPDLGITLRSSVISIDSQVIHDPGSVTLSGRQLGLVGDSESMREDRKVSWLTWFNNPVELEDHPIFEGQQRGVSSRGVRYSVIARGRDTTVGLRGDDNRLRHFWVQWRAMMGVDANSIDPQ